MKAVTIPGLFTGLRRPDLTLFFVVVVAIILLTAGLFGYINRLGVDFGKTVLVLAAGYNILIGLVKLGLAPAALHEANQKLAFDASVADPNSTWFYLAGTLLIPARLQGNVRDLQAALQTPGWRDRRCAGAEIPHWRVVWRRPYSGLLLDEIDKAEIFLAD